MNLSDDNEKNSDQSNFSFGEFFKEPSTDLLHSLSGKITEIIQREIHLLKAGFQEDLKASKITIGLLGAGILSGFITVVLLFVTLIFVLARFLPGWLASLIISGFTGILSAIIISAGWKNRVKDPFANIKRALNKRNIFLSEDKDTRRAA